MLKSWGNLYISYKKKLKLLNFNLKTYLVIAKVNIKNINIKTFIYIGEVPPHLHKLKTELEATFDSLE